MSKLDPNKPEDTKQRNKYRAKVRVYEAEIATSQKNIEPFLKREQQQNEQQALNKEIEQIQVIQYDPSTWELYQIEGSQKIDQNQKLLMN